MLLRNYCGKRIIAVGCGNFEYIFGDKGGGVTVKWVVVVSQSVSS